jgi:hypothetical protein
MFDEGCATSAGVRAGHLPNITLERYGWINFFGELSFNWILNYSWLKSHLVIVQTEVIAVRIDTPLGCRCDVTTCHDLVRAFQVPDLYIYATKYCGKCVFPFICMKPIRSVTRDVKV